MIAGLFGAGFGYAIASAADRFVAGHALTAGAAGAAATDTPPAGQIYNSEAVDLPIWSSWQRLAAAVGSIALPLVVAAWVKGPKMKAFWQIAGFGAVARTGGKAIDDGLGKLAASQPGVLVLTQLYAPELAASAKATAAATTALPAAPAGTFAGRNARQLAARRFGQNPAGIPTGGGQPAASNIPATAAMYAQIYLQNGLTTDPGIAALMAWLNASGLVAPSVPVAQQIAAVQDLIAQGWYAPNASGQCNSGDTIGDYGCLSAGGPGTSPAPSTFSAPGAGAPGTTAPSDNGTTPSQSPTPSPASPGGYTPGTAGGGGGAGNPWPGGGPGSSPGSGWGPDGGWGGGGNPYNPNNSNNPRWTGTPGSGGSGGGGGGSGSPSYPSGGGWPSSPSPTPTSSLPVGTPPSGSGIPFNPCGPPCTNPSDVPLQPCYVQCTTGYVQLPDCAVQMMQSNPLYLPPTASPVPPVVSPSVSTDEPPAQ